MLSVAIIAAVLLAITVAVHSSGLGFVMRYLIRPHARLPTHAWAISWLLIRITWLLIFLHLVEIGIWGAFYLWADCLPDAETAFYFSGVTYATVGYGDVVLPEPWRIMGPVEGLTGILLCGLSSGLFFAVVTRLYAARLGAKLNE